MKHLRTLGNAAGGFLMNPPPKAVLTTVFWVASRSHPAVATLVLVGMVYVWSRSDD